MVAGGKEMIVGLTEDSVFGHVVLVGLGGVFTELLDDSALAIVPIGRPEASAMVNSLKGFGMLKEFRGKPASDVTALCEALVGVSQMGAELGDYIAELDINPLIVLAEGKGVRVADALIRLKG
jgi:acetyltransferase